ncbi:MAG: hypothetical protein FWE95_09750 [Planctomycetaceae bacterium]|nr:hypothetical protein [Planctomycetaceae bacterium]
MPPFEINVNNMIQVSYPPGTVLRNETDGALWLEDGRDMTEELREDIRYRLTVFPTAPSEALAVGRGGPLGQTWIGKLTFDEKSGEQSFKLLLGTTRHLPTEDYLKPDVLAAHEQKDVVFSFPWICPFPDSKNPDLRQVLIGRVHGNGYQFGNVPLLVDLDTGEVMVITERYPDLHDFRYGIVVRCVNDCLVVIDGNRQLYVHYRGDDGTYRRDRIASRRSFALYVDGDRVYSPSGQFYSISGPNFSYYTIATTEIDLSAKKPISKSVEVRQTKHRDHVFYAPSAVFGNILLTTEQLIHTIETSVVPTAEPSMVHTIEPSMVHTTETDAVHPPAPPFTEIVSGDLLENPNASVESNRSLGGELLFVYVLVFMFALSLVVGLWLRRLYLIAYNVPANTSDRVQQIRTLIFVAVLLTAGVPAQSDVRIAIVPGGDPKPHELLVLTEAQLFELQEIELLDRTDIDKVLAEQRLSGMFSADNAVALGQILKTDMFVVLETKSVVIFDAHTGLRFIDETLPEKLPETLPNTLDDAIEVAVDAVKSAVEKRQKLTDETLVTFGVLEVRNADFPVARDAWCRAVGVILERSLLQRGGAVLERSRLQLVNQERQLPGDATNRLLASMKLINLEFTRVESLQSFRLTARVGNERFSVEGSFDAPLEAVHKLSEQLLGGNVRGVNRAATEAVRFAAEARFFLNSNKLDEALEKIEVAVALDPENPDHRRQLTRILSDHIRSRISNPNNRTFRYDTELNVNRLDAEAMRQAVQDIERLEALQGTVPGLIRRDIGILANHVLPEFKDVVREFNRRDLNREHARYREALNNVVDQETFQEYLRFLASSGYQDTLDLVPIRVEIVENTLRLSQEYGIEERVASLLKNFPSFVRRTYAERIAETAPDAAAQIEQTILLIEQDSRLVPQTCAWIARNRTIDVDRNVAARTAYFNLVKSYLANFPKEAELYESMILYDELMEILRRAEQSRILGRVGGESTFSLLRQLTEIIELADLRGEFVQDTVYDYIRWVVLINQESTDKTELLKLKEQFDPMIFRQFALAERQGIRQENIDNLRQQATRAGITETPQTVVIGRPWKSEINLFPREEGYAKIMTENIVIYNNVLYCEVRNIQSRKYYVACVDLATLEKRYVLSPFADHISSRIAHVDDTNIYLLGGGLHIIPLDGSESWTLTPEDGLPSGAFRVLGTLDGWCYAVLGFDWIIRFNLQTREWEQLSSSRAKEGKTPFVDGRRLERLESIVDPRREQILLAVTRGFNSFWAIQKDGTFVRLNTSQAPLRLIGFSDDQQKLFYNLGQLCAFDLDNKTVTQFGNVWEFSLHAGTAWNGYVWGALDHNGWRWGRKKIADESAFEPLVVPEQITPFPDKDRSLWFPFFCAPTSDGKNLIIASNFEVVLLRFE